MVQVRMREDYGINLARRYRRLLPVAQPPLFWSLEHAAVNQDLEPLFAGRIGSGIDEMFGSSYSAGSAEKLQIGHGRPWSFRFVEADYCIKAFLAATRMQGCSLPHSSVR